MCPAFLNTRRPASGGRRVGELLAAQAGTDQHWPNHLPVGAFRFARPAARLAECTHFYRDVLGLTVISDFTGHNGYDGVILGLPGHSVHLELTYQAADPHIPEPSSENQFVFYLPDADVVADVATRLRAAGHEPVRLENPYWSARGVLAFVDPDGWHVLFAPWVYRA